MDIFSSSEVDVKRSYEDFIDLAPIKYIRDSWLQKEEIEPE